MKCWPKDSPLRRQAYDRALRWFKSPKGKANEARRWKIEMQQYPERKVAHATRQRHTSRYKAALNQAIIVIALEANAV